MYEKPLKYFSKCSTCFLLGPLAGNLVSCNAITSASIRIIVSITFLVSTALFESLVKAAFNESIFHEINFKLLLLIGFYDKLACFLQNLYSEYYVFHFL